MDIYLLASDGAELHLPVNPSEIQVETAKRTETVTIIALGEIEIPVSDQPVGVSFSSFFPRDYDAGYCRYADIPKPEDALAKLLAWQETGQPVRLLITDSPVNMLVIVAKVNYKYAGGEPGDIYYDLALRQWREIKVRSVAAATVTTPVPAPATTTRPDTKPVQKVYVVRSGDTLYKIAKAELGNGSKWRQIYDANKDTIGPDPNLLHVGLKLVMPS